MASTAATQSLTARSAVRIESNSFSTFLPLYKQLRQLTSVGSIMSSIRLDVTDCLSTSGMCMKKGSAWNFVRKHKTGNGTPCWHRTSAAGPRRHEKEHVKVAHLTTGCEYGALANRYWDTSWFITLSTTAQRLFLSWTRWIQASSPMLFIYKIFQYCPPSAPRSSKLSFLQVFPLISPLPICATWPTNLITLD